MSSNTKLPGEGTSEEISKEPKSTTNFSESCEKTFARLKFFVYADVGSKGVSTENHLKRLQSLRKELNYIKETEWKYEPIEKRIGQLYYFSYENSKLEYEKKLEEELAKLDDETKQEEEQTFDRLRKHDVEEIVNDEKRCFRRIGIITSIQSNHGIIDKMFLFDIISAASDVEELRVGFKVEYIAYKTDENEFVKVVKILQVINDYWDVEPTEEFINKEISQLKDAEPEYFSTHQRSILGLIIHRNENLITVDTDYEKIDVDLDAVCLEFVPQLGDRVYLNCNVQTDMSFVDSAGEVLEVLSVYPARSKNIKSSITAVYESWGVINEDCLFSFDILPESYTPAEGDIVTGDIVECSRDNFVWRCIKLVPLEKAKATLISLPPSKNDLFSNKEGIVVTNNIKFRFNNLYEIVEKELVISNESQRVHKVLRSVFLGKKSESQLRLLEPGLKDSFFLNPGESRTFRLQGKAQFYGYSKEIFVITFPGFKIGRKIQIEVGVNEENNKENLPVQRNFGKNGIYANQVWSRKYDLIPGISVAIKPRFVTNKIPMFEVPKGLREAVLTSHRGEIPLNVENLYPCVREDLSNYNYSYRFSTLLHLEEIEFFVSIRQYDRERAHFIREMEYLALEIENLAEKRPSLIIGDSVKVTNPWAEAADNRCFEGVIHKVYHNRILLKFNPGFHENYNGEDYRVEFYFSRFTFRKQHYAVRKVIQHLGQQILFPSKIKINEDVQLNVSLDEDYNLIPEDTSKKVKWFNPNLNTVQKIAIKNVLRGEARPMPYVIFGPPGTGKTMTLVETILQLVTLIPNSRLLVGTPSNSAADLIASRLIGCEALKPGDFVRLVSHNLVERDLIPDHLKPYCCTADISAEGSTKDNMIVTDSGLKLKCQLKHMGRHRITIGTCISLGTLLQMGFPPSHFTHVLIDEAGQCLEPESMVIVTQVEKSSGQIVLAGDPLQLGPIVLNKYAADRGLEMSFLVRLLKRVPYQKDKERFSDTGYDPRLVTKLVYNYRSLPSILKLYNDLFYNSELKSMVDDNESKDAKLLRSLKDVLPNPDVRADNHGVCFVGIRGENRQDPDSPSWYNAAEARSVFLFVLKLYKLQVSPKSIGIITPYQKQVRCMRNIFAEADLILPKIGSVEEFQGQERDIILISTVRSKKSLVQIDLRHALGFVQSTKRMNVAISRARAVLVVFGNPHLLTLDPCWKKLIKYCLDNNSYIGCDLPADML